LVTQGGPGIVGGTQTVNVAKGVHCVLPKAVLK